VVYHGSRKQFDEFKSTRYADGSISFSTNVDLANKYPIGSGGHRAPDYDIDATMSEMRVFVDNMNRELGMYDLDEKAEDWLAQYDAIRKKVEEAFYDKYGFKTEYEYERAVGAQVYPVYLSIQKPFDPRTMWQEIESWLIEQKILDAEGIRLGMHKRGNWIVYENKAVIDELRSRGYDGVWISEDSDGPHETINVWDTTKIKSIFNTGAWSKDDARLLFMGADEVTGNDKVIPEARDSATLEEWKAKILETTRRTTGFTNEENEWLAARFKYAHSAKVKRFSAKGSFTSFLAKGENLEDFLRRADFALYGDMTQLDEQGKKSVERLKRLLSSAPEIKKLVDARRKSDAKENPIAKNTMLALFKRNENVAKVVYGEMTGDQDLIDEALDDMQYIPEIKKRSTLTKPDISIREMGDLFNKITSKAIRDKLENGTITLKEMRDYVDLLELKGKDGAKKAKADQKAKDAERRAARQIAEMMAKYKAFIFAAPKGMSIDGYVTLSFIQQYLSTGGDLSKMPILASRLFQRTPAMLQGLIRFMEEMGGKDYDIWTFEQVKEMADYVDTIRKRGRFSKRQHEIEYGLMAQDARRTLINAFQSQKGYKPPAERGSKKAEDNENKSKLRAIADLPFMRIDLFASQLIDKELQSGSEGGFAEQLLAGRMMKAQRAKLTNVSRREGAVKHFIKANKMAKTLAESVVIEGVGYNDGKLTVTRDQALGIHLLVGTRDNFNQQQRDAFIYGNLFDPDTEKRIGQRSSFAEADEYMMDKYDDKLESLLSFLEANLTEQELELGKMIMKEMNDADSWGRFADTIIKLSDKEPIKEAFYFPLYRQGALTAGEDSIQDAMKGKGDFGNFMNTGMTIERLRNMSPHNHRPVRYQATSVFFDAVDHQEHLINFGEYAKLLSGVFNNNMHSEALMSIIEANLGKAGVKYVQDWVKVVANPSAFENTGEDMGDLPTRLLRGTTVISNLSWRWTSVMTQLLTSPLPFLSEASPGMMMAVAAEAAMKGPSWYHEIEKQSAILEARQMDQIKEDIESMKDGFIKKLGQEGMKGLEFADRFSVAIGWEAVRREKLKTLGEAGAREYADQVVVRTQPSSDPLYRAPIYRNMTVGKQLILQFTQPLNVVWQNIRYDMPQSLRDHDYKKFIGYLAAYSLSGLAMGLVRSIRGYGPDDDDPDKWAKYWLHASMSQYLESIPFAGDALSSLTRSWLTGDTVDMPDDNMPAMSDLVNGVRAFGKGDITKAFVNTGLALGQFTGIPTRAVQDGIRLYSAFSGEN